MFPNRRLKNGEHVTRYDQFLTYLLEKDERIEEEILNFGGRNKVLSFFPCEKEEEEEGVGVGRGGDDDTATIMYFAIKKVIDGECDKIRKCLTLS